MIKKLQFVLSVTMSVNMSVIFQILELLTQLKICVSLSIVVTYTCK